MKTMKAISGIMALALILATTGVLRAQNENIVTQERNPGSFTILVCNGAGNYYVSQGDVDQVKIEGPADILDKVKTDANNGKLVLGDEEKISGQVKYYITCKDLQRLETNGAATVEGKTPFKLKNLTIEASGASQTDLELEVEKLTSSVSGASGLNLKGSADMHISDVSGAANLKATELKTRVTEIGVSGAGSANIDATEEVKGDVTGAGNLYNKSNPGNMDVVTSGAGTIETDTTKLKFGDKRVMIFDRDCDGRHSEHKGPRNMVTRDGVRTQWMGLELGVNGYVNSDFGFDTPAGYGFFEPDYGKSFSIGLNIFEYGVPLVKKHMTLVTGLGFEFNNYAFRNNYVLLSDTNMLTAVNTPGADFDRNKLSVSWFRIPLMLQFDSKQNRRGGSFHFSMGVIGAIKMSSISKQSWKIDDTKYHMKTKDDFNLNPFKADATVRIGYGYLNLFVNYSLTSMFRNGEGPKLFPVSAGITLLNF